MASKINRINVGGTTYDLGHDLEFESQVNKEITEVKTAVNSKYAKPPLGIPKSDLHIELRTELQEHENLTNMFHAFALQDDMYLYTPNYTYSPGDRFYYTHNGTEWMFEVIKTCTGVKPPNNTYYKHITVSSILDKIKDDHDRVTNYFTNSYKRYNEAISVWGFWTCCMFQVNQDRKTRVKGWETIATLGPRFIPDTTRKFSIMNNTTTNITELPCMLRIIGSTSNDSGLAPGTVQVYNYIAGSYSISGGGVFYIPAGNVGKSV